MCYRTEIKSNLKNIAKRFNATFDSNNTPILGEEINGFSYPATPVITNQNPDTISSDIHWGLVPLFAKDDSIKKNTLNARIETLEELPSFRDAVNNRCLIIATGYYEWHWNDEKGKTKTKHLIKSANDEIFAFAGIYSSWVNPQTGALFKSYAMVTTTANKTMSYIHNHKLRMPVMLKSSDEKAWLDLNHSVSEFAFPNYDLGLIAFSI